MIPNALHIVEDLEKEDMIKDGNLKE